MRNKFTRALVLFAVVALALGAIAQVTQAQPSGPGMVLVSTTKPGQTQDGVSYGREDILALWEDDWYNVFDGSDYGLDGKRHNVNAFGFPWYGVGGPGDISGTLPFGLLSFSAPQVSVPDIPVKVAAQDIVVFETFTDDIRASGGGSFYLVFDGSDVGLNLASERIDGLSWYPYSSGGSTGDYITHDCTEGVFFISTVGNYVVPMANGSEGPVTWLKGSGSDILLFCATEIGYNTAGYWYKVFDSFDAGVTPRNAIDSISVWAFDDDEDGYSMSFGFSTKSRFSAPGVGGDPSDLIFAEAWYSDTIGSEYMFENFGGVNDYAPRLNGKVDAGEFFPYIR